MVIHPGSSKTDRSELWPLTAAGRAQSCTRPSLTSFCCTAADQDCTSCWQEQQSFVWLSLSLATTFLNPSLLAHSTIILTKWESIVSLHLPGCPALLALCPLCHNSWVLWYCRLSLRLLRQNVSSSQYSHLLHTALSVLQTDTLTSTSKRVDP